MITSIKHIADILNVSKSTIYRWIKKGDLEAHQPNGIIELIDSKINSDFITRKIVEKSKMPIKPNIPKELKHYDNWHRILDEFVWLFKICYSNKEIIKTRKFRLDVIFQQYLNTHKITLKKIYNIFRSNRSPNITDIKNDLQRGWYNELSFLLPLKKSTLGLSFSDITLNEEISNIRFAFPSWKIITAYYSIYFYIRAITLLKTCDFRIEQHISTLNTFKNSVLGSLEKVIWKFPLNISYNPKKYFYKNKLYLRNVPHVIYKYSFHPRPPYLNPYKLSADIHNTFKIKSNIKQNPFQYNIFDFLLEFRIWVNYLDIDSLINLRSSGYKAFIDQNLSFLLFIIGGISELCYISIFGEEEYLKLFQNLYNLFVLNNAELDRDFINTSLYQRAYIFQKNNFLKNLINLRNKVNVNEIQII